MRGRSFLAALALIGLAHAAAAASIPLITGPQDPSQMNATINGVINNINAILSPLTGYTTSPVNLIALPGAASGAVATISLQAGADTNAAIGISPNGSGAIVLFAGGYTDTGVLQFGNPTSFIAANGLGACPGIVPNTPPLGVGKVVTGYVPVLDWLNRPHAFPVC